MCIKFPSDKDVGQSLVSKMAFIPAETSWNKGGLFKRDLELLCCFDPLMSSQAALLFPAPFSIAKIVAGRYLEAKKILQENASCHGWMLADDDTEEK